VTKKPHRTRPLDRDGDGQDGGSLKGNRTAPMAGAEDTALDAIAEAEPDLVETARADHDQAAESLDAAAEDQEPDPTDTFTPEEVAAGRTPVIEQEGEAATTAADTATVIDPADPLVTVDTDTAPVAVRLSELGTLVSSRRLYKTPEGYSATYSAPFIDAATVDGWVKAGLAETIPSAGNTGGVRATAEARAMAGRLRQQQRQVEAA